jgi:hypothetical protein
VIASLMPSGAGRSFRAAGHVSRARVTGPRISRSSTSDRPQGTVQAAGGDEEVSARFSASQSSRSIATTIAGELDVSGRKRGDDQTGPKCTRLKNPTTDAHGSGFLCPVVRRVACRTDVRRFPGLRLSALRPSLLRRSGVAAL